MRAVSCNAGTGTLRRNKMDSRPAGAVWARQNPAAHAIHPQMRQATDGTHTQELALSAGGCRSMLG